VNQATNESYRTETNATGQYTFLNVLPGTYRVTVNSPGFREGAVDSVTIAVAKSALADVVLQIGAATSTVEIVAGASTELQTVDSSVGDVVSAEELEPLPTNQRNAIELLFLQPGTLPAMGVGAQYYGRGGNVSGARGNQNTPLLDGIDTTERFTSLDYSNMTLPVDAVEEFRGTTSNPSTNLGATSSGGYFTFSTRRGTNELHGAAYGYLQNSELNANTWDLNFFGERRPELKDERFGGRLGDRMNSLSGEPREPRNIALGLSGQLSPHLINDFRFGFNEIDYTYAAILARTQLPAAGVPLNLAGTLLDDPGDPDPTRARPQAVGERGLTFTDTLSWMSGSHTIQAGFTSERREFCNSRPDRTDLTVIPVASITAGQFVSIPATQRPPTCSGAQANCLEAGDVSTWDSLYGAALGIWDNTQTLVIRNAQRSPTTNQFLVNDDFAWHHEFHAIDTWRLSNSLTVSYGLNFIEKPCADNKGREYFFIDIATGKPVLAKEYLTEKEAAAAQGETCNLPLIREPKKPCDTVQ
jgi:hypothetical protein